MDESSLIIGRVKKPKSVPCLEFKIFQFITASFELKKVLFNYLFTYIELPFGRERTVNISGCFAGFKGFLALIGCAFKDIFGMYMRIRSTLKNPTFVPRPEFQIIFQIIITSVMKESGRTWLWAQTGLGLKYFQVWINPCAACG